MTTGYRWMVFVDGENLTLQGQKLAEAKGIQLTKGTNWEKDVFLWVPGFPGEHAFSSRADHTPDVPYPLDGRARRAHYYTAVQGDQMRVTDVKRRLRALHFDAEVFKKVNRKSKGVDNLRCSPFVGQKMGLVKRASPAHGCWNGRSP